MKDTKTYLTGFSFFAWVMPQEWDFGALGARGSNFLFLFFKHDHVAHQIEGDDEQNRMQVKVSS